MAPKRKAPSSVPSSREPTKRVATDAPSAPASLSRKRETGSPSKMTDGNSGEAPAEKSSMPQFNQSCGEEEYGVVQREFYPPEMSNERCAQYNNNEIPRPMDVLQATISQTAEARNKIEIGEAVVHWFKRDLRTQDNRALSLAAEKAKSKGVPLVCMFIVSPQDYQAHLTSAVRVDFELRTLAVLKEDLAQLDIPLHVETMEVRKQVPDHIVELCKRWGAKHIFCNIEYEVDELRREKKLIDKCLAQGISFAAVHDDVVVAPGSLHTGTGKQYAVYSPWFRTWVAHIHSNLDLLEPFPSPTQNPVSARINFQDIFDSSVPAAPPNKSLSDEEKKRFHAMWPAGEHEAHERLQKFLGEKVNKYKETRNFPAAGSTAVVSVHFSSGTLAARTAIREARNANSSKKLDGGDMGVAGWIGEVAWRDFYKHVMAHWPYVCMNKPFKYEYTNIEWEYNQDHFDKWCKGLTGYPIVDAAMRQLNHMGYMHNRCRMIVASFLAKDLLLDWRMGERYFMENLIDGDFASNNGGWGFSASTGVDPQPYFRIFNPLLQSEKFDLEGDYIRKWIPELRDVQGKAIHEPYGRGMAKTAEKNGYPKPIVNHKECRDRCLARYKSGLGRDTS